METETQARSYLKIEDSVGPDLGSPWEEYSGMETYLCHPQSLPCRDPGKGQLTRSLLFLQQLDRRFTISPEWCSETQFLQLIRVTWNLFLAPQGLVINVPHSQPLPSQGHRATVISMTLC